MTLETRDVVLPEPAVLLGPLRDFLNAVGLEPINALAPFPLFMNESRAPKNPQVLRDRRTTHPEPGCELIHRRRSFPEAVENRPPGGIGDREEDIGMGGRSGHQKMGNVSVTYFMPLRKASQARAARIRPVVGQSVYVLICCCGLRIEDFAASGPTAIDDLRLSEDCGEKRNDALVLFEALRANCHGLLRTRFYASLVVLT